MKMIAQYYPEYKTIAIYKNRNSSRVFSFESRDRALFGLPPLKEWNKMDWGGLELEFKFEVTDVGDKK